VPSKTAKQAKFMKAVANNPKFAKKVGVSQSVGKDFEMADKKMKKFGDGGSAKKPSMPKEPASGGASTVPLTPERKKFLAEMERRNKAARGAAATEAAKTNPDSGRAKGGKVMKKVKKASGGKCYAKGGSVSSRADGVAKKGKTHTKMVAMKRGGKC
jgi:hypothetical protein